ncbi:MAG: c-type cytochrome [Roseovarius sp.]|nr:c-type cytochrome [Roseovarius sp.]
MPPIRTLASLFALLPLPALAGDLPTDPEALAEGAAIFERRCSQCHGLDGVIYKAPWLNGLIGRPAASVPDFPYSEAMRAWGGTWTVETLTAWLTKPDELVPGTEMNFGGFRRRTEDRDKVIAYLVEATREAATQAARP